MPATKQAHSGIDFDTILSQPAYITCLNEFLQERDDSKALRYCVETFIPEKKLTSISTIKNAILGIIADIDEKINTQVNDIIHYAKFQKLEASWRGLWLLVRQADGKQNIKIRMLDISWPEVVKDIDRALEFDQSQLFHKIYSKEYGMPGGEPYGVIIGDYEISHRVSKNSPHDDMATLEGMIQIAAASLAPFITSASSDMFGMEDFSALGLPFKLKTIFSQKEYIKWHALRKKTDSRFLGLTLPRILIRQPYRKTPGSYKGIYFYEKSSKNGENHLWGNACYAFAIILIREFINVGWFGHIRGVPRNYTSGGLVTELPVDHFETDMESIAHKPVTDVIVTDAAEKEISELGFIPLCQGYLSPHATWYNNQSIHKSTRYKQPAASTNAQLSGMLQHVLCGSRIAHYIKVMIRDKVGSFTTADRCQRFLRDWLLEYTTGREDLNWEEQARYPLKEASVRVKEHPSRPGEYLCVIHLQPHYQLDQMVSELELVTELASLEN
ncbi:MAG: type VI secretion system contractile sheath large subunit [Gammaproteobacteria bacterium]|nr:type VI secretion system contractile sheath large subunit [Gammaproteobacteria bacterium]